MRFHSKICLFCLWAFLLLYSVQDTAFFWDTVQLGSKHAHFFYENNLQWLVLPQEIDSGHPPVFGYVLACFWTVFGKNLMVSHWMMLPLLCGIIWQLALLGRRIAGEKWAFWFLPLALFDPVLAGQMALISPDTALVFFFLLSLNAILKNKEEPNKRSTILLSLGIIGLCLISTRGMMTATVLFIFSFLDSFFFKKETMFTPFSTKLFLKKSFFLGLPFLPGALLGLAFLFWHFNQVGWIGFHEEMPWAPAFDAVSFKGILRNMAIIVWRWLDFNRFIIFLICSFLFFKQKQIPLKRHEILLFGLMISLLSVSALLYKNLSAHRYFLPTMLWVNVLFFAWLTRSMFSDFWKKSILILAILSLALGNFWRNPEGISMDWDTTLGHVHFTEALKDIQSKIGQSIDYQEVGTQFPIKNTGENLFLNGDQRVFAEKDLTKNQYILYSNIVNDFTDAEIDELYSTWRLRYHVEHGLIRMTLYERTKTED